MLLMHEFIFSGGKMENINWQVIANKAYSYPQTDVHLFQQEKAKA
jgi:hypothetical protein